MPQTRIFEIFNPVQAAVGAGYVAGYAFGWSDAQTGTTTSETVEAVAEPITDVNPLVSHHGVFRDDPTWDNFMQSIDEYRRYINSLEE